MLVSQFLLTGLGSIQGMFCLSGHVLAPAKQLVVVAVAGIAFALTASLLLLSTQSNTRIIVISEKSKSFIVPVFLIQISRRL